MNTPDAKKVVKKEKVVSILKVMNLLYGTIEDIDEGSGEALANFLVDNSDAIEKYCREHFSPSIDPTDKKWRKIRNRVARMTRPPISTQAQAVVNARCRHANQGIQLFDR